jgi:hypothetical protein
VALGNSLEKLKAFRQADKYEAFREALPDVHYAIEDQKKIISDLLDACCAELIKLFQAGKKPTKLILKKNIAKWMDEIANAPVDNVNKDFGYELCWYLSDIAGLKLKLSSENKRWGYWGIVENEVRIVIKKKAAKK